MLVESTEEVEAVTDFPAFVVFGEEGDGLVGEDLGEVNEMTAPLELAVVTDPADGELGVVLHLGELGREGARGRLMDTARSAAVDFMRALPVELMDKGIEAALLGTQGVGGRGNGGSLQRAVHALVPTVLTGAGGASSLGTNAQADPPLGQVADAAYGQGGKRRPVVRTQGLRQAVLPHGFTACAVGSTPDTATHSGCSCR